MSRAKLLPAQLAFWFGIAALCFSSIETIRWQFVRDAVGDVSPDPLDRVRELLTAFWEVSIFEFHPARPLLLLGIAAIVALGITFVRPPARGAQWFALVCLSLGLALGRSALATESMNTHSYSVASMFTLTVVVLTTLWAFLVVEGEVLAFSKFIAMAPAALLLALAVTKLFVIFPGTSDDRELDGWLSQHPAHLPQLLALAAIGLALTVALKLELNPRAVALLFGLGLLTLPRSLAIRRDESAYRPSEHRMLLEPRLLEALAPAKFCRGRVADFGPMVRIAGGEVTVNATLISRAGDPPEFSGELVATLNVATAPGLTLSLEQVTPLPMVLEVLRGADQASRRKLQLLALKTEPAAWRAGRFLHQHLCVVDVELADDGLPASAFKSWAELVETADAAEVPLRIAPR
ncbi:MAG: hypothetical protein QM817_01185 [Archangium sp.]